MTTNRKRKFLIEKVAEDFVQTISKDHPVMLFELDTAIREYITNNEQGYRMDDRINLEIISESEMLNTQGAFPYQYNRVHNNVSR